MYVQVYSSRPGELVSADQLATGSTPADARDETSSERRVFCWPDIPWIITSSSFVYLSILLNYNLLGVIYMLCDGVAEYVYLSNRYRQ